MTNKSAEYLQKISQHLFNLQAIIYAYKTKPIEENKKLHKFFDREKKELSTLLDKQTIKLTIKSLEISSLSQSFVYGRPTSEF